MVVPLKNQGVTGNKVAPRDAMKKITETIRAPGAEKVWEPLGYTKKRK